MHISDLIQKNVSEGGNFFVLIQVGVIVDEEIGQIASDVSLLYPSLSTALLF